MKHRKWTIGIIGIVAALLVFSGSAMAGKKDGVLRAGWTQEPRTLNPMGYDTIQGGMIMRSMLYDTLLGYDETLTPAAGLAKSWKVSDDGLTWTFDIVQGAAWHDGAPLTSADIAFTYQYVIDNKIPNFINYLKSIDKSKHRMKRP